MKTNIYLIRHGATVVSGRDPFAGSIDVELSDEGRTQAVQLAKRLQTVKLDALYCSPMRRTMETASIIGKSHGLTPQKEDGLREINYGMWDGLDKAVVAEQFPENWAQWQEDPYGTAPGGGDAGASVLARALPVFQEIVERHRGQTVAMVAHKGTNRLLISSLLGLDPRRFRDRLDQHPAALNLLEVSPHFQVRLGLFNDISHYE